MPLSETRREAQKLVFDEIYIEEEDKPDYKTAMIIGKMFEYAWNAAPYHQKLAAKENPAVAMSPLVRNLVRNVQGQVTLACLEACSDGDNK